MSKSIVVLVERQVLELYLSNSEGKRESEGDVANEGCLGMPRDRPCASNVSHYLPFVEESPKVARLLPSSPKNLPGSSKISQESPESL